MMTEARDGPGTEGDGHAATSQVDPGEASRPRYRFR